MTRTLGTIVNAYSKLWREFGDASADQNLGVDGSPPHVLREKDINTARAMFFLRGWPYRAVATEKSVDIAVMITEQFSDDLTQIVHATTCIGYFRRDKKASGQEVSRPLLELHYDFETPVQEAHPMFHAQVGRTEWPEKKFAEWGMTPIERPQGDSQYGKVRIPSAFMGFGTALVALAADHLHARNFRKVLTAARAIDLVGFAPRCASFVDHLNTLGCIPYAHCWYDGRYVVHEWGSGKRLKVAVPVLDWQREGKNKILLRRQVVEMLDVAFNQIQFVSHAPPN